MPAAYQIVGVVEDTKYGNPANPPRPMFFTPISQALAYPDERGMSIERLDHFANNLIVHYRGDSGSMSALVRQTLKSIDPNIPELSMRTYKEQLSDNFTQQELVVRLTTLFGLLALLLASIGLYGVTAYTVARRRSEIGIRMALGATRGSVLRSTLGRAVTQAAVGLALGVPLSLVAGRLLQHTLYQTSSFQPLVLAGVAALLLFAACAAAILPARSAASVDPALALRTE
jgi:ABC-type antimicrobial peptide transport system permease subunit